MKYYRILAGLAGVLILAPLVVPVVAPWSEINCRHQEINIRTGQARYTRMLWFARVSVSIEDTPLSQALQGETVDLAEIEPWHRVNTFYLGNKVSPHYIFHGAFSQIHRLNNLQLPPERQREAARTILQLWQGTGQDGGAEGYLSELEKSSLD